MIDRSEKLPINNIFIRNLSFLFYISLDVDNKLGYSQEKDLDINKKEVNLSEFQI